MVQYSGGGGGSPGVQGGYAPLDSGLHVPLQYLNGITSTQIASGTIPGELGQASITSNFPGSSASPTDVTGLTVTVTVGSRPIYIMVFGAFVGLNAAGNVEFFLLEGASGVQAAQYSATAALGGIAPLWMLTRRAPTPGSYTYKVQYQIVGGTPTMTLNASSSQPCWIVVHEA